MQIGTNGRPARPCSPDREPVPASAPLFLAKHHLTPRRHLAISPLLSHSPNGPRPRSTCHVPRKHATRAAAFRFGSRARRRGGLGGGENLEPFRSFCGLRRHAGPTTKAMSIRFRFAPRGDPLFFFQTPLTA